MFLRVPLLVPALVRPCLVSLFAVLACTPDDGAGGGADDDVPGDSDDDPTPPTGTDTVAFPTTTEANHGYARPHTLEATCEATGNALRMACHVTVDPPQPVEVSYWRDDAIGTPQTRAGIDASEQDVILYFLAPDKAYTYEVRATQWPDEPIVSGSFQSGIPPMAIGTWIESTGTSTAGMLGTNNPCSEDMGAVAVIYDALTGELIWYHTLDASGNLGPINMIYFTPEQTVVGDTSSNVVEVDLNGVELANWEQGVDFPVTLHHDIFKKHDRYYSLFRYYPNPGLLLDGVIIIDALTGTEITRWLEGDHLDTPPDAAGHYFHTNSVFVDDKDDIYLSFFQQDTIIKIEGDLASPDFGKTLWILESDPSGGLVGDVQTDWSNVLGENGFDIQHGLSVRPDGRLMMVDNGNGRALVMSLDEGTKTATVDAAYDTAAAQCGAQGTALSTQAGNALVGCAGTPLREYDGVTGDMVWEGDIQCRDGAPTNFQGIRIYPLDAWLAPPVP